MTQAATLQSRTYRFAVQIVRLCQSLPPSLEAREIGRQLIRSGTSVAANYRAACRSRSRAEFIAKIGTVIEEADETVLWLELLGDTVVERSRDGELKNLIREGEELVAISVASQKTARANLPSKPGKLRQSPHV